MLCPGPQNIAPTPNESKAAELRAVELFRADFLRRFPDGIVLSELEYLAATTFAPRQPGGIRYPGRPQLNRILSGLQQDFRKWLRDRDYRKPDGMGISVAGSVGELVEVTTVGRVLAADTQLRDKLDTLNRTVNGVHDLQIEWRRTRWRPSGPQLFYVLPPLPNEVLRYVCYVPTDREHAPDGVILYEIHAIKRVPDPLPIRQDEKDKMRQALRDRTLQPATADAWARQFALEHPILMGAVKALALVGGVALAIAAVVAAFDPVPGDEVAAGSAAAALVRFALSAA